MNDKYLRYNLDDFLNDDSFISYVKNSDSSNVKFWENWISINPQKQDICKEAQLIIQSIQFKENLPTIEQKQKIWNNIKLGIEKSKPKKVPILKIALGIAASIILLVFIFNIGDDTEVITNTSFAETSSLILPDNSVVELNADSKISYDKSSWKGERVLTMSGEAFFKVQKGEKFSVKTKKAIVEVLGTSFNVYDRNDMLDVRCETGKVRVINRLVNDTLLLMPGFGAKIIGKQKLLLYNFEIVKGNTWKEGVFSFKDKTLKFVFEELERQYNIKVDADNIILERIYTGQFNLEDLEKSLYNICWPMHLNYKIEGEKIKIIDN